MSTGSRLSATVLAAATAPNFAVLSTASATGAPSAYVMWIDHDDHDVIINTTIGQPKTRHLTHGATVSVLLLDHRSAYHYVELRGTVTGATDGLQAAEHFARLAFAYTGRDMPDPPANRRIYRITPNHVREHGSFQARAHD